MDYSTFGLEAVLTKIATSAALESNLFQQLAGASAPLVIYGAGQLGRKTLAGLRKHGVEPLAFLDRKAELQGKSIEGLPVRHPGDGTTGLPKDMVVVLAIWWSPGRNCDHKKITNELTTFGFSNVISFIPLFWTYPGTFLPHFRLDLPSKALASAEEIRRAYALLVDQASRQCFTEQLDWELSPEVAVLEMQPLEKRYNEHAIYQPKPDEVFVDCGAYTGDTLSLFLEQRGGFFSRYTALEPEPQNYARLQSLVANLPASQQSKITCLPFATSACRQKIRFSSGLQFSSRADTSGDIEVEGVSLDEICAGLDVTYIKMDIEGAEPAAIMGARATIKRCAPVVAACVYHQQDHLWTLVLLLHAINPRYHFFMRRYEDEYGDVVLYAVPPDRLATKELQ